MILSLSLLLLPCLVCTHTDRVDVTDINTDNIYEGLIKPDNVAIHVLQNTVNWVASGVAWGLLTHFYQSGSRNRVKREDIGNNREGMNDDLESIDDDDEAPD